MKLAFWKRPVAPNNTEIATLILEENRLLHDQVKGLTEQAGLQHNQHSLVISTYQKILIATVLKYSDEIIIDKALWDEASTGHYLLDLQTSPEGTTTIVVKQQAEREPTDEELAELEVELSNEEEQ